VIDRAKQAPMLKYFDASVTRKALHDISTIFRSLLKWTRRRTSRSCFHRALHGFCMLLAACCGRLYTLADTAPCAIPRPQNVTSAPENPQLVETSPVGMNISCMPSTFEIAKTLNAPRSCKKGIATASKCQIVCMLQLPLPNVQYHYPPPEPR